MLGMLLFSECGSFHHCFIYILQLSNCSVHSVNEPSITLPAGSDDSERRFILRCVNIPLRDGVHQYMHFSSYFLLFLFILHSKFGMAAQVCYASAKNKGPILDVLRPRLDTYRQTLGLNRPLTVLEIASGTGEHASFFTSQIPGLLWQPTEPMTEMHSSIVAWCADMNVPMTAAVGSTTTEQSVVLPPIALDVMTFESATAAGLPSSFGEGRVDLMVCINMIHISPWAATEGLFRIANHCLKKDGLLLTYGPYRVNGHMVESNQQFSESLMSRNPEWGIRDKEAVEEVASREGLVLHETIGMPANNLCLLFRKT